MKLAVFDCDGTLVDGQAAVCEAMELAFASAGLPAPARHDVRRIVGLSLPQAVRHLAPDAPLERQVAAVEGYKAAFRASREEGRLEEPLFEGMDALLRTLAADGWTLAVATGKSDRGLAACLAGHGIADLFVSLQTADRHPSKPHPAMVTECCDEAGMAPRETIVIGDAIYDMQMAKAAGATAIGVAWGYANPDELWKAGADAVVERPADLLAYIH